MSSPLTASCPIVGKRRVKFTGRPAKFCLLPAACAPTREAARFCTRPEAECRLGLKPFRRRSLAGLAARPSAEKGAAGIARQYGDRNNEIGRASWRERVWQCVYILVCAVSLKKKKNM